MLWNGGNASCATAHSAVVVPIRVAPVLLKETLEHEEWETFSRLRLAQGGSLWTYYPLSEDGRREYEAWRRDHGK